jgi:hypothetical protein
MIEGFSLGWALVGVVFFLPIGLLLLLMPYTIQRYALHLYQYPGDERRAQFLRSYSYIVTLRVLGFACTVVGLALAAITIAAILVPGFAAFRR